MPKSINKSLPIKSKDEELVLVAALADYRDSCRKKHDTKGSQLAQSLLESYLK